MAGLGTKFKAEDHDTEQRDYSDLPDGVYRLEVTASEVKKGDNKAGLNLTMDVIEPEDFKGRKLFNYINIEHPTVQAQEIGQKELASLCRAIGVSEIDDTEELHLLPFYAKIGMGKPSKDKDENGNPKFPAKNEIKRYYFPDKEDMPTPEITGPARPANDNRKPAANQNDARQTQNSGSATTSTAAAGGKRPWATKK